MTYDRDYLLNQSKSFCILPWIHLYADPKGHPSPCCVSTFVSDQTINVNSRTHSMMEIMNADYMKQLRVDMLSDMLPPTCRRCHQDDARGAQSTRTSMNSEYAHRLDLSSTTATGEISNFKMHYFDIRFNNICNFKCRSCGSGFSSQWEQEDQKYFKSANKPLLPKNNNKEFLQEVIDQIVNIDDAYFAGGEPLITEEHYVLLEEMIKQGRTDIVLRYNTNLSNLTFKDKDLLGLWKHFKRKIQVYASIYHYGSRAEYIRHGTDWGLVENNFLMVKKTPYVNIQTNTVLSLYNALTILEFYQYMYDKNLFHKDDQSNTMYPLAGPVQFNLNILPMHYKNIAKAKMEQLIEYTEKIGADCVIPGRTSDKVKQLADTLSFYSPTSTWEQHKALFKSETLRVDGIRGESFTNTFPELAGLLDE